MGPDNMTASDSGILPGEVLRACKDLLPDAVRFLDELVRFPSLSSEEGPAMHWLADAFRGVADESETVPVPESITEDPEYSFRIGNFPYADRPNVRAVLRGNGGRSVLLNSHADVVPPSPGQERPFDPFIRDGALYGRGACDAKGQIATAYLLFSVMRALGVRPAGDIILHLVIEEETGGNGTLAMVRCGGTADCCINLEPTSSRILTSVRGAIWFKCTVTGRAGHSGSPGSTVSALLLAIEAMEIIKKYHDELLAATHNDDPLFAAHPNPMPVTFGRMAAGDWPAMVPRTAVFEGVFGILTTPRETVINELIRRVRTEGPGLLRDNAIFSFPYRHDTSRVAPDHPMVAALAAAAGDVGVNAPIAGAPFSSDAWFYNNLLGIPTVVSGCGDIAHAHTGEENIVIDDIARQAAVLFRFIERWSGLHSARTTP